MSYQTLLALQALEETEARLRPVASFAKAIGAHVDVVVLDLVVPFPTVTSEPLSPYEWNASFPKQIEAIESRAVSVRRYLEEQGVEASAIGEAQQIGMIGETVAKAALASDLVVLTAPAGGSLLGGMMGRALDGALFGAGKPVLMLGEQDRVSPLAPGNAIIAWDGGREAARAVQAALPLLQDAECVTLMVIEDSGEFELDDSARLLGHHLQRHGVETAIERVAPAGRFVTHAFAEHVADRNPDLLVMGAYGHTRLRERLFSGVTRTALSELHTPLLLAH